MIYIKNQHGRIVQVDEAAGKEMIRRGEAKPVSEEAGEEYYRRKNEAVKHNSSTPESVFFSAPSGTPDGYGMSRDIIKRELFQLGIAVGETYDEQKVGLLYNYPYGILQMRTDVKLVMTMFESDRIPEDWAEYLKAAHEVIVPSKWCADTFNRAGIKTTVVPLGYNDRVFKYLDRPIPVEEKEPFTFIHYGAFNLRKGFSEVWKAFTEEFKPNEPVRLILKSTRPPALPIMKEQYPNVEVISEELTEQKLVELLARANCMVYPSRGEGFGITPLEAMATGIPAIVPDAHGISEYFNRQYMMEVKVAGTCPPIYKPSKFGKQNVGEMVTCDVGDLRKQMRYAVNNQREMHDLGASASEYVKRYTYQVMAKRLSSIITKWRRADVVKQGDSKYLPLERV